MTDNEIITALKCCKNLHHTECACCPLGKGKDCIEKLAGSALDLINRQKAEIKRLKKGWKADIIETENIKTEAIKEFAYRLKQIPKKSVSKREIDEMVKEMVGDAE